MLQESKLDSHLRISAQSSRALCVPSPFNLVSRIIIRSHWFCWVSSASWTVRFKSQAHVISRAFIGTRFSFASLVYYQDYLRSLSSPRFLDTPLVTQAILRGQLFPRVECQLPKPSYGICATGTSLTTIMIELRGVYGRDTRSFTEIAQRTKCPGLMLSNVMP